MVYGEMSVEKIKTKIDNADCIYIGGGDTVFMLDKWKEFGIDKMIVSAYEQGKIICGLSAGAICWFKTMYTDYEIMRGKSSDYAIKEGLGVLNGAMCPHFNDREEDFIPAMKKFDIKKAYAVENDCAIEFVNGEFTKSISAGGKAFIITNDNGIITKREI
jgi:peptidase E